MKKFSSHALKPCSHPKLPYCLCRSEYEEEPAQPPKHEEELSRQNMKKSPMSVSIIRVRFHRVRVHDHHTVKESMKKSPLSLQNMKKSPMSMSITRVRFHRDRFHEHHTQESMKKSPLSLQNMQKSPY